MSHWTRDACEVHLLSRLGIVLLGRVPSSCSHGGFWLQSIENEFLLQGWYVRLSTTPV